MAEIIKRTWRSGPRGVKRTSWGYTLQVHGKQERKFDGAWTEEEAQTELGKRLDQVRAGVERIREYAAVGAGPHRVRERGHEGGTAGLPVPRPPSHRGQPHDHARRQPQGRAGAARPRRHQDDDALRAPVAGAPARDGRSARWHHAGAVGGARSAHGSAQSAKIGAQRRVSPCAPVAQLDRASAFEAEGRGFDSLRARHFSHFSS